jgi:hypothetical protein
LSSSKDWIALDEDHPIHYLGPKLNQDDYNSSPAILVSQGGGNEEDDQSRMDNPKTAD